MTNMFKLVISLMCAVGLLACVAIVRSSFRTNDPDAVFAIAIGAILAFAFLCLGIFIHRNNL